MSLYICDGKLTVLFSFLQVFEKKIQIVLYINDYLYTEGVAQDV